MTISDDITAVSTITRSSWRDLLPVHPAADLFPLMSPDELIELGNDIKTNGLRIPIAVIEGPDDQPILVDGRNRLNAMELVGLKIVIEDVAAFVDCAKPTQGFDPYAYVISANIHRRHLTAEQRREVIAKVLKADPSKSNRQIAEQVKDDHKKVGRVRATLEATGAVPQLETTTGADGKKRPARSSRRGTCVRPKTAKNTNIVERALGLVAKMDEAEREEFLQIYREKYQLKAGGSA